MSRGSRSPVGLTNGRFVPQRLRNCLPDAHGGALRVRAAGAGRLPGGWCPSGRLIWGRRVVSLMWVCGWCCRPGWRLRWGLWWMSLMSVCGWPERPGGSRRAVAHGARRPSVSLAAPGAVRGEGAAGRTTRARARQRRVAAPARRGATRREPAAARRTPRAAHRAGARLRPAARDRVECRYAVCPSSRRIRARALTRCLLTLFAERRRAPSRAISAYPNPATNSARSSR